MINEKLHHKEDYGIPYVAVVEVFTIMLKEISRQDLRYYTQKATKASRYVM